MADKPQMKMVPDNTPAPEPKPDAPLPE